MPLPRPVAENGAGLRPVRKYRRLLWGLTILALGVVIFVPSSLLYRHTSARFDASQCLLNTLSEHLIGGHNFKSMAKLASAVDRAQPGYLWDKGERTTFPARWRDLEFGYRKKFNASVPPSRVPIMWDKKPLKGRLVNVLFLDGSVVTMQEAKLKTLFAGLPKVKGAGKAPRVRNQASRRDE
jgi:prepilin-type processing-associated H-X9-DG protein